ncbi:MscS Mechanosensitive ion channel [Thermobaculum terrenum ATCC BAA-798]|uniref:MscS Mechanosensitive ion channel n=1 Tax=Thermobaculum terrenum (strain ATCC BAA-798 / CCMEE 7001 / YNP1) TaxID=525904 RepID=D1CB17_THET1|nr:mechanosensitive ion channel domain-containing protein [Thermobaculum terrenum]ACZ41982.1 MscS Mechanosensitive ion channel [Thermobaculum terrenum ATCC BAA-798]
MIPQVYDLTQQTLTKAADIIGKIAVLLIALIISITIGRYIRDRIVRTGNRALRDPAIVALLSNIAFVSVIILGILTALPLVGVQITAIVTVLGVSGLAVSLALQDILRNFIAGIYILLEKPFNIGDRITIRDQTGNVRTIELRTTVLETDNGTKVIIPNSVLMTDIISNKAASNLLPYLVTIKANREVILQIVEWYPSLANEIPELNLMPKPETRIDLIEDENTTLGLRYWLPKDSLLIGEIAAKIKEHYPQVNINVKVEA